MVHLVCATIKQNYTKRVKQQALFCFIKLFLFDGSNYEMAESEIESLLVQNNNRKHSTLQPKSMCVHKRAPYIQLQLKLYFMFISAVFQL